MSDLPDYRVILIGDGNVGKSSFWHYYVHGSCDEELGRTFHAEYGTKLVEIGPGVKVKLQIWDTVGQERYRSITRHFYRGSAGVIVMYDITDRRSFHDLEEWIKDVKTCVEKETVFMLIGHKSDQEAKRTVSTEAALYFANQHQMQFRETSAINGHNIVESFQAISEEIHRVRDGRDASSRDLGRNVKLLRNEKSRTKCCH